MNDRSEHFLLVIVIVLVIVRRLLLDHDYEQEQALI
jgi:hypothetical protein